MANQVALTISATISGVYSDSFNPGNQTISLSAVGQASGIQSIGTSEENLSVGDVATPGWLFMQNLDATNYVQWGMSDSGTMKTVGRMKPGEPAVLRVDAGATVRMKANSGPCNVKYILLAD